MVQYFLPHVSAADGSTQKVTTMYETWLEMTQFCDIKKLKFCSENNTISLWETYEGHIIDSKT